jgi:hypothetical protein
MFDIHDYLNFQSEDSLWLYQDSTVRRPSYKNAVNYKKRYENTLHLQKKMEMLLKDHLVFNELLGDEIYLCQNTQSPCQVAAPSETSSSSDESTNSLLLLKKKPKTLTKQFCCSVDKCDREYSSIDALALHIKRKHTEFYKTTGVTRKVLQRFKIQSEPIEGSLITKSMRRYNSKNPEKVDSQSTHSSDALSKRSADEFDCGIKCDDTKMRISRDDWEGQEFGFDISLINSDFF